MSAPIFMLVILLFTKDGPAPITKMFEDRFDCEVAEGVMLTAALKDKDVLGWQIVTECKPYSPASKV